jgi:hypothetical protein
MFTSFSFAAEKAFDSYGLYDLTKTLNQPVIDNINIILKAIYDQDGLSFYLFNANGVEGSRMDFLKGFLEKYVLANPEIADKGVAVLWDDAGGYASIPFSKDGSLSAIYTTEYLNRTIKAAINSTRSGYFELYESIALELRARAKEYKDGETDALASSNDPIPNKLDRPNYVKIQVFINDVGRRYIRAEFEMSSATAKLNNNVDLVVSSNLDWKINDGPWFSELNGQETKAVFLPYRANARAIALFSDFYEDGDWGNIDVENNVYSFRGYFDFVTPDGKQIRSPFTDVITLMAKK